MYWDVVFLLKLFREYYQIEFQYGVETTRKQLLLYQLYFIIVLKSLLTLKKHFIVHPNDLKNRIQYMVLSYQQDIANCLYEVEKLNTSDFQNTIATVQNIQPSWQLAPHIFPKKT